jgi:hypothetical protein
MSKPRQSKLMRPRRRWLRIGLWGLAILLLIPVLSWVGLAAYLHHNNKEVLAEVLRKLNKNFSGKLIVSRMETTMLSDFPEVSIALYDVYLRDSLWDKHGRNLLALKRVYVKASPASLLGKELEIREVRIADGSFDLFTDANGYSNGYLLKSKDTSSKTRRDASVRHALIENVRVSIQHTPKDKLIGLLIRSLDLNARDRGDVEALKVVMEVQIDGLGFNTERGSFAKNKLLVTSLDMTFNTKTRMLDIPLQDMKLNKELVRMAASVYLGPEDKRYSLRFVAPQIMLEEGSSFLAENISSKLALLKLQKPIVAEATVDGLFEERNPKAHVLFRVKDNVLSTPAGTFSDCSFSGYFDNEYVAGVERLDANSVIEVDRFSGTYEDIRIYADTVAIRNLIDPRLHALVRSKFDAAAINRLTGGKTFRFSKGVANVNLRYDGSLSLIDKVVPAVYGNVTISGAEGIYVPRGLPLSDINGQLVFEGADVRFPRVNFRTGTSSIAMSGFADNLLGAMHQPQVPASLRWTVASSRVDVADFMPFLQKRAGVVRAKERSSTPMSDRLDEVLDNADAHVTANIADAQYQKFRARDVQAEVLLTSTRIQLKRASLKHADGTIVVSGDVDQGSEGNVFAMKAAVDDIDANQLFSTFDNFGQKALTAENIRGQVSLNADLKGRLNKGGGLTSESMTGNLVFDVRKGALLSFAPLEKVGRYIFKRRDLSHLRFEVLQATFHLAKDKIEIEPMQVRSSALSLNLVGVYGLDKGTDISFQVPLRNPKRDSVDLARHVAYEIGDRGIVVHLRAKNPDGQKLNIGWDKGGKRYKALLAKREPEEEVEAQPGDSVEKVEEGAEQKEATDKSPGGTR